LSVDISWQCISGATASPTAAAPALTIGLQRFGHWSRESVEKKSVGDHEDLHAFVRVPSVSRVASVTSSQTISTRSMGSQNVMQVTLQTKLQVKT